MSIYFVLDIRLTIERYCNKLKEKMYPLNLTRAYYYLIFIITTNRIMICHYVYLECNKLCPRGQNPLSVNPTFNIILTKNNHTSLVNGVT